VATGASLALVNLTLQGGSTGFESWARGGAIYNAGNLALTAVTVQNNIAEGRRGTMCIRCDRNTRGGIGWPGEGGGIYSTGALLVENSLLLNNQARGGDGGIGPAGGGRGGDARGGGLSSTAGTATLLGNIVSGNAARRGLGGDGYRDAPNGLPGGGYGGGIYIANAQVGLDEFTVAHVAGNTASTSDPNISGPYEITLDLPPLPSDFNNDGAINAADFAQWQGDFGLNGESDADNDNDSDGADFLAWQRQLGSGAPSVVASATVPEPTAASLLVSGLLAAASAHRRR
jgi:hypothetical protein